MADFRFLRQRVLTPSELSLDAVTLAANRTSAVFDLTGVSQLAVYLNLSAYSSETSVKVYLDLSPEVPGSYVAYDQQSIAVAAGVGTATDLYVTHTVAAAENWEIRFRDLNAMSGKIRLVRAAGAAGDVISVKAIAAYGF